MTALISDSEKEKLLDMSQISIKVNNYNDIFSSFDPRPYVKRALSDDFLLELKHATFEKADDLEIKFIIPKSERDIPVENIIRKRLKDHIKHHQEILLKEVRKIRRNGIFMALLGMLFIIIATYLAHLDSSNILITFLIVVLEPAGWFTAWTGLDQFYYTIQEKRQDLEFYNKISNAEVKFHPY